MSRLYASRYSLPAGLVAFACLTLAAGLWACETPVYRYAMYRWQPTPYEVYLMHDGPVSDGDADVLARIKQLSRDKQNPANVLAFDVDLSEADALDRIPADVKRFWESQEKSTTPTYLITSPVGIHVFHGALNKDGLDQLVNSPARKSLTRELAAGKAGVLLLLDGNDKQASDEAYELLKQVAADISTGKVSLYKSPSELPAAGPPGTGDSPGSPDATNDPKSEETPADADTAAGDTADADTAADADAGEDESSKAASVEIAVVRIRRDDPSEQWLVRTLLAVEDDLTDFTEPMVFAVYGRARALPPYIGKGISRRNLLECVEFITGACSCTVKEQNPGVDLLVRFDWETAAAAVAEKFGSEEGNESQFGDSFFPELIVPSSAASQDPAETADGGSPQANTVAANQGGTDDPRPRTDGGAGDPAATATSDSPREEPADTSPDGSAQADSAQADSADQTGAESHDDGDSKNNGAVATAAGVSGARKETPAEHFQAESAWGMAVIGGGLALALIVLFAATFLVLRPR